MLGGVLPKGTTVDDVIEATKHLPKPERDLLKKAVEQGGMFVRPGAQAIAKNSLVAIE